MELGSPSKLAFRIFFLFTLVTRTLLHASYDDQIIQMDDTERCFMDALMPDIPQNSIIIHDHQIITKALMNFELLDSEIQRKIKNCNLDLSPPRKRCELAFGQANCEKYHMMFFQKCAQGFTPVGCCICALTCPKETNPISQGLLCKKPEVLLRNLSKDADTTCLGGMHKCSKFGQYFVKNCPKGKTYFFYRETKIF